MTTYAFCAPIANRDELTSLAGQLMGDRRSEAVAIRTKAGIDREQVFIQETPMGEIAVIVWDTDDFTKAVDVLLHDTSDFGKWFTGKLQLVHGFDLAAAPAPKPEVAGEWIDSSWSFADLDSWAFAFPIKDVAAARKFVTELMGARKDEFVSTRLSFGVKRNTFSMLETPDGTFALVYVEGDAGSFPKAFAATATSTEPFLTWWRETVQGFAAVPMFQGGTAPKITQVLDLTVRVPSRA